MLRCFDEGKKELLSSEKKRSPSLNLNCHRGGGGKRRGSSSRSAKRTSNPSGLAGAPRKEEGKEEGVCHEVTYRPRKLAPVKERERGGSACDEMIKDPFFRAREGAAGEEERGRGKKGKNNKQSPSSTCIFPSCILIFRRNPDRPARNGEGEGKTVLEKKTRLNYFFGPNGAKGTGEGRREKREEGRERGEPLFID